MDARTSPDSRQRGSRVALSGLVFAVLFVVGFVLLGESPAMGASDEVIIRYFSDPDQRRRSLIAGLWIIPFASIAFIWFIAAFRQRLLHASGSEHPMFSGVQLIAGCIFVAALLVVGATELSTAWLAAATDGKVDVDATRAVLAFGDAMAQVVTLRAAAVFIAVSSTRGLRSGLFPRWLGVGGFVVATALLLVATTWRPVVLVLPIWVLGASWAVLTGRENLPEAIEA